jgi:hypothetical protein
VSRNATVEVCADCRGYAEAPHSPLVDTAGQSTGWVLCLDCHEALTLRLVRQILRQGLGGEQN